MPLQVWYQPQTADVGLLLGTLSGAVIDYLNNNGEERLLELIIVAGRQEHCDKANKIPLQYLVLAENYCKVLPTPLKYHCKVKMGPNS